MTTHKAKTTTKAAAAPKDEPVLAPAPPPPPPVTPPPPGPRQPDLVWAGQPVYRCRLCGEQYERVANLAAVLDHERTQHPTNARVSQVLGPGGQPLIVVD